METLPFAAYFCDRKGRITAFNARAERLWGRCPSPDDPRDRYCVAPELFAPDGSPLERDICWTALALKEQRPAPDGPRARQLRL